MTRVKYFCDMEGVNTYTEKYYWPLGIIFEDMVKNNDPSIIEKQRVLHFLMCWV